MNKAAFLLILLVLLVPFSLALSNEDLEELEDQPLPGIIGSLFGKERINLYIGDSKYSIITQDKIIYSIEEGELSNPTMNVWTDEETVNKLENSKNILNDFQKALDEGKIKYKAVGFVRSVKLSFVSFFVKVAGWLSGGDDETNEEKKETVCGDGIVQKPESCDGSESLSSLEKQDNVMCSEKCMKQQKVKFWASPNGADLYVDGNLSSSNMQGEVFIDLLEGKHTYKFVYQNHVETGEFTVPRNGIGAANGVNVRFSISAVKRGLRWV